MRTFCSALVLATTAIVVGAWGSDATTPPTCPPAKQQARSVIHRDDFYVYCGPARAVVRAKGIAHIFRHGKCYPGRVVFGVWSERSVPHEGMGLRFDSPKPGPADVIDGVLELVPGVRTGLSGKALINADLRGGTFTAVGQGGSGEGLRFTGSWACR